MIGGLDFDLAFIASDLEMMSEYTGNSHILDETTFGKLLTLPQICFPCGTDGWTRNDAGTS